MTEACMACEQIAAGVPEPADWPRPLPPVVRLCGLHFARVVLHTLAGGDPPFIGSRVEQLEPR